jgi:hypothetical protein
VVNSGSSSKYENYNKATGSNESGNSYTIINDSEYPVVDGVKTKVIKPVEKWAIGKYQHYYKYHESKIIDALNAEGISTSGLSKKDIAMAYSNSPKAQDAVQTKLNDINFSNAEKQIEKYGLKASVEEIAYLNHYLGDAGAERYIRYLKKYGQDKADQMMAYGKDPDDSEFSGIGGPDSLVPNALVSKHILNFKSKL